MITFAGLSPHAPIFLPEVGSPEDREAVKNTITSLESLGASLKKAKPEIIIISSPHTDWGINVPLYFLDPPASFKVVDYQTPDEIIIDPTRKSIIYPIITTLDSPQQHYQWGQTLYNDLLKNCALNIALVGSGDMSHCLKIDGPYGFHPDGPQYDQALAEALKKKDIATIWQLDGLYPEAGECGLKSFTFILGILEAAGLNYQPQILSYEGPFGVGYLVANIKINH
jgi:aromatic ring-opening dioxygenase LigB subunit